MNCKFVINLWLIGNRYLFNCGEGTQRLAHEHKMKLSKLEHIFVTYPSWENIGGLPGVALTIQDVGVPEITLHGPAGTVCYVSFLVLGNNGLAKTISLYF
jgi:ribonuclease BN (tRNA processing enzyme)